MLLNAFLLALREIRRNRLRSFLTILGVVIGVASLLNLALLEMRDRRGDGKGG